jgi:hypothetical protein
VGGRAAGAQPLPLLVAHPTVLARTHQAEAGPHAVRELGVAQMAGVRKQRDEQRVALECFGETAVDPDTDLAALDLAEPHKAAHRRVHGSHGSKGFPSIETPIHAVK